MLALALAYGLVFLFTTSKKGDIRKGLKTLSCNKGTNHNGNKLLGTATSYQQSAVEHGI